MLKPGMLPYVLTSTPMESFLIICHLIMNAKSIEVVPRIDRDGTPSQRHSMTTTRRPNVMEVDLGTGVIIPTQFRIYTEDFHRLQGRSSSSCYKLQGR